MIKAEKIEYPVIDTGEGNFVTDKNDLVKIVQNPQNQINALKDIVKQSMQHVDSVCRLHKDVSFQNMEKVLGDLVIQMTSTLYNILAREDLLKDKFVGHDVFAYFIEDFTVNIISTIRMATNSAKSNEENTVK